MLRRSILGIMAGLMVGGAAQAQLKLEHLSSTRLEGPFGAGAAEISAYDAGSKRLFVSNGAFNSLSILNIEDPTAPQKVLELSLKPYGAGVNSVAVYNGLVAAAVYGADAARSGKVIFFNTDGAYLGEVRVGSLPDMLTFTHDGQSLLTANEGEPTPDYSLDPEGSVSVITIPEDLRRLSEATVRSADFHGFNAPGLAPNVRIFGPRATNAKDVEPEYISIVSNTAYVTLQENNAIAVVDIETATVTEVIGLGYKDHSVEGQGLDASDRDSVINIAPAPVRGLYLPDGIAAFRALDGFTYLVTANEGDSRTYPGFNEEARIGDLPLDPTIFPNAAELQKPENLGRLKVTNTLGDTDGDGDWDELYAFGARSFSIFDAHGRLVFDSGDQFERYLAENYPDYFNADGTSNTAKTRSDDKGPEPEGVTLAQINGHTYAFVGLERFGGVFVYDVTDPEHAEMVTYATSRNFAEEPGDGTGGDLSPEGLLYIAPYDSPTGRPLLVLSHEISGTVAIFELREEITGLAGQTPKAAVTIAPNPAQSTVRILTQDAIRSAELFDAAGRSVRQTTAHVLDVADLPAGLYLLRVETATGLTTQKIVKQ